MKLKDWKEYTQEEKERLLIQWLYNYSSQLVNQDEIIEFYKLLDDNIDKMKDFAVSCYAMGVSNEYLLKAFQGNFVGMLLDSIPEEKELDEVSKKMLAKKERDLLSILAVLCSREENARTLDLVNNE